MMQEERKIERALIPSKTFEHYDLPRWTKDVLIKMMEMMTSSPKGVVEYSKMCKEFGRDVVNSVIEYNLMHIRPNHRLSYDIPNMQDL